MPLIDSFLQRMRRWNAARRGVRIAPGTRIGSAVSLRPGRGRIQIGRNCTLENGVILEAHGGELTVGEWVHLGPYSVIYGHGNISIGKGTLLSPHTRILSSNHAQPPLGTFIRSQPDQVKTTRIGEDVWLGAGVTVLGGVTIGDGCIVGAGAVVTKDLPAGAIAYGVPAVVRGYRPGADPTLPGNENRGRPDQGH